jgi:hypothetical protein
MTDEREKKIRQILEGSKPAGGDVGVGQVIQVTFGPGDAQVIGNNNVIRIIKAEKVTTRNVIDPSGGELSPHQKLRLKDLVDGIVRAAAGAGNPTSHGAAWKRFQRHFQINTYHALPATQYEEAKKYLSMLYGRAKRGDL